MYTIGIHDELCIYEHTYVHILTLVQKFNFYECIYIIYIHVYIIYMRICIKYCR